MQHSIYLANLAITLLLSACSSGSGIAQDSDYIYEPEEFETHLDGLTARFMEESEGPLNTGDTAQIMAIWRQTVCDCYNAIDIDYYYDSWLALEESHQEKGYRDMSAVMDYGRENHLTAMEETCSEILKMTLPLVVKYAGDPKAAFSSLFTEGCGDFFEKRRLYTVMQDSMYNVNQNLKYGGEDGWSDSLKASINQRFQEMEENGEMTEEMRRMQADFNKAANNKR
jgi:hypothetical protein